MEQELVDAARAPTAFAASRQSTHRLHWTRSVPSCRLQSLLGIRRSLWRTGLAIRARTLRTATGQCSPPLSLSLLRAVRGPPYRRRRGPRGGRSSGPRISAPQAPSRLNRPPQPRPPCPMQLDGQAAAPVNGLTTSSRANGRAWQQMSGVQGVTMLAPHGVRGGAHPPPSHGRYREALGYRARPTVRTPRRMAYIGPILR